MWSIYVSDGRLLYAKNSKEEMNKMIFMIPIAIIYIAIRLIVDGSQMGDFYKNSAKTYDKTGQHNMANYSRQKAEENDNAAGCGAVIIGFFIIVILLALCGVGG